MPGALPQESQRQDTGLANVTDRDLAAFTPQQLQELNQTLLNETKSDRALISEKMPMSVLRQEYEGGSGVFVRRIDWLVNQGYNAIRRSRGDGDCFYRSLGFAYVERILNAPDVALAVATSLSALQATLPMLKAAGFEPLVYEDFYETFTSLIQQIVTPDEHGARLTSAILLEAFQSDEVSNSIVVYLRLLTSAEIRTDADNFSAFLFHPETGEPMGVREFCEHNVEAINREADHVQVTALARALKVNIKVAYLDGRGNSEKVDFVEFHNNEDTGTTDVVLLYRPGHYDILEKM